MLTSGNKKLGSDLIWGFGLPSGRASVCAGMTATCRKHCYAVRTEQYRATAKVHYEKNLKLTKTKGFARRLRAFLFAHHIRVVRIHTGGEFYSARYARKWLRIVRRSPRVRFFAYSRAWRVPAIRAELEALAREPNCRIWFSVDRDTGIPDGVPVGIRLAWLMADAGDVPPVPVDLVFRVQALRRRPLSTVGESPVCPAEDGFTRAVPATCDTCRTCWKPPMSILRTAAGAQSGQTVNAFCRARKLTRSNFDRWRRILAAEPGVLPPKPAAEFVPLRVAVEPMAEVVLRSGIVVRVPLGAAPEAVTRLVAAVGAVSC